SSLAGTQALGNLKVIYDDNRISIEGDTHYAFTEDVSARYRAYGWHVIDVAAQANGDVDRVALEAAMEVAVATTTKPTLIRLKTVIAWPAPKARNTAKSHGSALGADEVAATKKELGIPSEDFYFPGEIEEHVKKVGVRGKDLRTHWNKSFEAWQKSHPDGAALLSRLVKGELPGGWDASLPSYSSDREVSTRKVSGDVINSLSRSLPELVGGSADLAESNNTTIEEGGSFLPLTSTMEDANPYGRIIHFGIREHAMGSILNGMVLHGLVRPFGGTFLVF
ncbi:MAG: transketolase, partial [Actinomycetota bacterium]